jgi:hypothetical protein
MTEKARRTVTISESNDDWLGQTGRNASELVDNLVTEYRKGGGSKGAVLQLRIEQLEAEIDNLETQLGSKREQLERLNDRKDRAEKRELESEQDRWETTLSKLSFREYESVGVTITSDDDIVERRALEHGMDIETFREAAINRWEDRAA